MTVPGYFDVALRDVGLFVAALALFRLSFHRNVSTALSKTAPDKQE